MGRWKLHHLGIEVRDLDRAVEYFESLGVGEFQPEVQWDNQTYYTDYKMRGKSPATTVKNRMRSLQLDSLLIELFQPIEGDSIHSEFLKSSGEGLSTIAFTVDDLEQETSRLAKNGFKVISSARTQKGAAFNYFDTRRFGNVLIELIQPAAR